MKYRKRPKEPEHPLKDDPYYQALKREEPVESMFKDTIKLDTKNYFKELDRRDKIIGRYPVGFRHYENYENYKVIYPEANLEDYTQTSKFLYSFKKNSE